MCTARISALQSTLKKGPAPVARLCLVCFLFLMVSCGGEGKKAPYRPSGNEEGQCPSLHSLTERTSDALDDDALISIAPVINNILIDDGGLRALFPVGRSLLRNVPPSELLSVTHEIEEGRGLARMSPHLVQVLAYMDGRSAFIEGEHYGSLDATYEILSDCAPMAVLGAARRTLELEETLPSGEVVPWIEPAFEALIDVADDPFFETYLPA
ncbi:MAG: DUF4348 domain-containing protein [Deltaproteobacteria bacterium]|nr:DUF4348 domain-containing protein [Deltaproteobacteria bacterium]